MLPKVPRCRASIVRSYSYGQPCTSPYTTLEEPSYTSYSPESAPPLSLCSDSMDIEISPPSPSPPTSR